MAAIVQVKKVRRYKGQVGIVCDLSVILMRSVRLVGLSEVCFCLFNRRRILDFVYNSPISAHFLRIFMHLHARTFAFSHIPG